MRNQSRQMSYSVPRAAPAYSRWLRLSILGCVLLGANMARANEATCQSRVRTCLQPIACSDAGKGQAGYCWTNRCSFKEYLALGTMQAAAPLKQGEVMSSSVNDAFKPDPKGASRRILDCEDAESAQAIDALPAASAAAAATVVANPSNSAVGGAAAAPAVATAASAPSPRESCGKRVFVALISCMQNTCRRPEYLGHKDCKGYEPTR